MNATLTRDEHRRATLVADMQAFFSLAMGERRRAHAYRRWALEAEAAGNLLGFRTWREASDQQWKSAKWAIRKAMERKDALNG
jgi:hypothetical protein